MSESALSSASDPLSTAEVTEIVLLFLLLLLVAFLVSRCLGMRASVPADRGEGLYHGEPHWMWWPEIQLLMLALPLHSLWELAQFPLYTVWHDSGWPQILYALVHCTLGDMMILLSVFWLVSAFNRSRHWMYAPSVMLNATLFTVLGLAYTVYSEIVNTRIDKSWAYTELMPIVPVVEVGGTPFMQWLLISPVLVWLMRLTRAAMLRTTDG